MEMQIQIPRAVLTALNQVYEIEQKVKKHGDPGNISRHLGKVKDAFAEEGLPMWDTGGAQLRLGLVCEDPMGQSFNETRTDLEATISGTGTEHLVVVEVIKPIVRAVVRDGAGQFSRVIQKGIVVVESRKEQQKHE
jgi:hypothetical protein